MVNLTLINGLSLVKGPLLLSNTYESNESFTMTACLRENRGHIYIKYIFNRKSSLIKK